VKAINADFDDYTIAASFIKNYKLLKNSVTHRGVLITNIHVSVIAGRHIEAKSCKLMPTSIVVKQKICLHEKNIIYGLLLFVSINNVWTKQNGYGESNQR